MTFDKVLYLIEMKKMVDMAIERLLNEKPGYELFTASIWTDPNASTSAISFDSRKNSDNKVNQSNEWSKKEHEQYIAEGDMEQAKLFETKASRNCNPADFELRNFEEIYNTSIPNNWEEETSGRCWMELEPALQEIGTYAFKKINQLRIHSNFQLAVNGRQDWYEFIWPKL